MVLHSETQPQPHVMHEVNPAQTMQRIHAADMEYRYKHDCFFNPRTAAFTAPNTTH